MIIPTLVSQAPGNPITSALWNGTVVGGLQAAQNPVMFKGYATDHYQFNRRHQLGFAGQRRVRHGRRALNHDQYESIHLSDGRRVPLLGLLDYR
jgi:hypothetical protein